MTVSDQFVVVEHRRRAQPGAERPLRRFSVDEYHWLIERGFFGSDDRVELIDGYLVQMSPIRPPHAYCAGQLYQAFLLQLGSQAAVRSQQPITLPQQTSEPEPDLVLAIPPAQHYSTRHPGPEDILLLVEVADATLPSDRYAHERLTKLRLYAKAGIPEYWIVNLGERVVEVHRRPQTAGRQAAYGERQTVEAAESLAPLAFPECRIDFTQVFPEQGPIRL
jgi:Uma2 family endonuclease